MRILKKIGIILGWICLLGAFGFTVYYTYSQWISVRCQSVEVKINPSSPRFMDEDEIAGIIEKSGESIIGKRLSLINIHNLEAKLSSNTTLNNVEIFRKIESKGISFRGKLIVSVDQRTPVVRIKNAKDDYYLDKDGIRINTSPKYVERIVIATGTIPDLATRNGLIKLADHLNKDEFWRAQIEQIFIQANGELLMMPQVGNCLVEFGNPEEFELKLRNLKAVYQQGFKNMGWNRYKIISVKYRNQVVCTKK
jgi:cell division protein FtsQ